MVIGDALPGSG